MEQYNNLNLVSDREDDKLRNAKGKSRKTNHNLSLNTQTKVMRT
jgi:hypothetical protein